MTRYVLQARIGVFNEMDAEQVNSSGTLSAHQAQVIQDQLTVVTHYGDSKPPILHVELEAHGCDALRSED